MRSTETDPRYLRTRQALLDALLRLTAQRPAQSVTVSELTALAGVSRSSFYAHAASPADLLADHLSARLGPHLDLLGSVLTDSPEHFQERTREVYVDLLREVSESKEVFVHVFAETGSGTVLARLRTRFRVASEAFVSDLLTHLDEPPGELWTRMAVAQHSESLIIMIDSWLSSGAEKQPEDVVDTYLSLAPPWQLVRLDPGGRATIGRHRSLVRGRRRPCAGEVSSFPAPGEEPRG